MEKEKVNLSSELESAQDKIISQRRTGQMFVDDVVRKVKRGDITASFAALQFKRFVQMVNNGIKEIEDQAQDELLTVDYYAHGDYKLSFREGPRLVDYSECEEVAKMTKDLQEMKSHLKHALIGVEKGTTMLQPNHEFVDKNGEIRKLPKWKNVKNSIVLTKL